MDIEVCRGFPDALRDDVASLYYQAFQSKYEPLLGNQEQARQILGTDFHPSMSLVALREQKPVGIIGFQTLQSRFVELQRATLASVLGRFKGSTYYLVLRLFDRTAAKGELLLDGLAVSEQARGMGVGSALIGEVKQLASYEGFDCIRLDVVDTNPRAKALYERLGFVVEAEEDLAALESILGFRRVFTMRYRG